MTDSIHDELRHAAHRVDAEDLAELRRIVRDLSTVLSGVVHIMERDARDAGAPEAQQELLRRIDISGRVAGDTLSGTWTTPTGGGEFVFKMAVDCLSFDGKWRDAASDEWTFGWGGVLVD